MPLACTEEECLSPAAEPVEKHGQERTKLGFHRERLTSQHPPLANECS